eukprot:Rhum_TRINITY_DN14297_c20_g1::Rhum_TRINITY_DN14297_c20_g1_i1::g.78796::m.78796
MDDESSHSDDSDGHGPSPRRLTSLIDSEAKRQRKMTGDAVAEVDELLARFDAACSSLRSGDATCAAALRSLTADAADAAATSLAASREKAASAAELAERAAEYFRPAELYHEFDNSGEPWCGRKEAFLDLIGKHLYATGAVRAAAAFEDERGAEIDAELKERYAPLHVLLATVRRRDRAALQAWAEEARRSWRGGDPEGFAGPGHERMDGQLATLEFALHRLAAVELLRDGRRHAALGYIREHLAEAQKASDARWPAVLRLLGALAFVKDGEPFDAAAVPERYAAVASVEPLWEEVEQGTRACWCAVTQTPKNPHLMVAVAAGREVMPTLLKYMSLPTHFRKTKELHVPVLPKDMLFRSSISCPVTQQVTTDGDGSNPAMMLPCCHVISRAAVTTLSRPPGNMLKCPYCPSECRQSECKPLYL